MLDFKKLTNKYKIDIKGFNDAQANFYLYCNTINNPSYDVTIANQHFHIFCDKLQEIIEISLAELSLKEDTDIHRTSISEIIPKVGISTYETDMSITIGLFRDYYISTKIENPNYISYMQDEFFQLLGDLTKLGKFTFNEEPKLGSSFSQKHPLLYNKRGNLFKLYRNYMLSVANYSQCYSLGYINVEWDNEISKEDLIINYCESFKIMYRINQLLWQAKQKYESQAKEIYMSQFYKKY